MKRQIALRLLILLQGMVLLLGSSATVQAAAPESNELHAASAVVMEAESGRILYEKNGSEQRAMASTTKIMTLLVALEYGDMDQLVTISARAASQPKVNMKTREGETFRLRDLLYAMMLMSYNDTAVAIAEGVAGSVEDFCYLMNLKARELGAYQTHFVTPNGLDAEGHYSTAVDMALIAKAALADEEAMHIMGTRSYTIEAGNGNSRSVSLTNKNPLLSSYTAAVGGKTGFTAEAGLCLVGLAERDGTQLITVVLGSGWPPHSNYRVADTLKLFSYGFNDFYQYDIDLTQLDEQIKVEVSGGYEAVVGTKLQGSVRYYMEQDDEISLYYDLPYVVAAPVQAGDILGQAAVCVNGKVIDYVDVIAAESAEEKSFRRELWKVAEYVYRSILPSAAADLAEPAKSGSERDW